MTSCPGCSAANQPGSSFCWQCYRPLTATATGPATPRERPRSAPAAEPGRWRITIPGPRRIIRHTLIGFTVLALIGGVWTYLEDQQVALPDSIAGLERIENPDFDAHAEEVEGALGISVSAGTYAGPGRMFDVLAGSELDGMRPSRRIQGLPSIDQGVALKKAQIRSFRSATAFFACAPFIGAIHGTLCLWNGSGTTGVVYAYFTDMRGARGLAQEVQRVVGV